MGDRNESISPVRGALTQGGTGMPPMRLMVPCRALFIVPGVLGEFGSSQLSRNVERVALFFRLFEREESLTVAVTAYCGRPGFGSNRVANKRDGGLPANSAPASRAQPSSSVDSQVEQLSPVAAPLRLHAAGA